MAYMKPPLTEDEVRRLTAGQLRKAYSELAKNYTRILDGDVVYCPIKDEFYSTREAFYTDTRFKNGVFPLSKAAVLDLATDVNKKTGVRTDNKEKAMNIFRLMDLPYIDRIFESQLQSIAESTGEKNRTTAFQQYITLIKSLPQYKKSTWKDSEFGEDNNIVEAETNRKARRDIRRFFGTGFSESDYLYLQDQYDDWKARTQVDTKSQEMYIKQICFKELEIWKAQKAGTDTDKLIRSLNDLMASANLQPRQNVDNAATDSLTFGELIKKWEDERPISTPAPEFQDVDNIGKYIRVWFAGHLAKALGLKNAYSEEYEEEMAKYTVEKPDFNEEGGSSQIYDQLFGNEGDL